jgi:hypothetical protein
MGLLLSNAVVSTYHEITEMESSFRQLTTGLSKIASDIEEVCQDTCFQNHRSGSKDMSWTHKDHLITYAMRQSLTTNYQEALPM